MMDRIIGALTFRSGVYAEVENDQSFTMTAWLIVAAVAFLSAIGSAFGTDASVGGAVIGAVGSAVFAMIGFAVGVAVLNFVAKTLFSADVNFGELQRTLGLAYIWRVVGILALIPFLGGFIGMVAWVLSFLATLMATKEAVDLEWPQTIVSVVIAYAAIFAVIFVGGLILVAIGFGAAAGLGLLGG